MKDSAVNLETVQTTKKANGESIRILWWLLATITSIAVAGAWFWVAGITARLTTVEAYQTSSIERIARLEEALKNLYMDLGKIDGKVAETNTKLDRLLEYWYQTGPFKQRGTNA